MTSSPRSPAALALVISVALGLVAWWGRTGAVGGSDSACYALMAKAYAEGRLQPESPLALAAPWPDPTRVGAPGGFLPSTSRPGAAVPVCAPGYGLLAAPLVALGGGPALYLASPLAAALLAWTAYLLTRRLSGAWAGVGTALLVACHPLVLFQAVQPMNDIVTAALWVGVAWAVVAARPVAAGGLLGLGLLVRPNLAPAAVAAVGAVMWLASRQRSAGRWRAAVGAGVRAGLAAFPGVAVALILNAALYGSPWQSGYGGLESLFALEHVAINLPRYATTWLATSTPLVLLSLVAAWMLPARSRPHAWVLVGLAAALSSIYLVYRPFPEWWYLRFFLPAVTLSLALSVSALAALAQRGAAGWWRQIAGAAVVVITAIWMVRTPEAAEARRLHRLEARYALTAAAVSSHLPPSAVAVASWQSGPIRFASNRDVVMWDALDPAWLDRAIAWLRDNGRPPVIVLERWEEDGFRHRFVGQTFGALDWPPRLDIDRRVQVYLPDDRDAYRRGDTVPTERVFAPRR